MNDTPRTDAVIDAAAWRSPDRWVTQIDVLTEHARQLERELEEKNEVLTLVVRELAQYKVDAERYRWLRNPERMHTITVEQWGGHRLTLHSEMLDAAIDAAAEPPEYFLDHDSNLCGKDCDGQH